MEILHLTLKREPFEVMITGEKNFEIREKSKWINSRLFDKNGNKGAYLGKAIVLDCDATIKARELLTKTERGQS